MTSSSKAGIGGGDPGLSGAAAKLPKALPTMLVDFPSRASKLDAV